MSKIKIFAIGGQNDVGKNMYVVEVDKKIFIFDAGLKYADDKMLGVDYIIPNFDFIKENLKNIQGIFITHGHQEQMGAICDIMAEVKDVKIYGTAFTLQTIRQELAADFVKFKSENLIELKPHKNVPFGDCSIFPISVTHSVPDAVGYVLYTKDGAIFYTGNFAFDSSMTGAFKTDIGKLAYVGKQGVLCLLGESLYADRPGFTAPQNRTNKAFREILSRAEKRILINVYESELARIQELLSEITAVNKKVIIMGKSLENTIMNAIEKKYIQFDKNRIENIHNVDSRGVVVIIADDRQKPFGNLKRIIRGADKFITIDSEDVVVIASQVYDGMEKTATDVFDQLAKLGCNLKILSTKKYLSYHASSEDLMMMLDLMQPKYYMPVIGEYRHLVANRDVARAYGMNDENILVKLSGQVVNFENGKYVDKNETFKVDDIMIDGKTVGDIGEAVLKDREALSENGIVIVTATLDRRTKQVLAGPEILTRGFIFVKDNIEIIKEAERISLEVINKYTNENRVDFNKIKSGVRDLVGRYLYEQTECKPMVLLVIQEV